MSFQSLTRTIDFSATLCKGPDKMHSFTRMSLYNEAINISFIIIQDKGILESVNINYSYKTLRNSLELNAIDAALLVVAMNSSKRAYAPYSKFHVGAAIRLETGKIIEGNNQENIAYPSGLCAERVAFFAASAQNPDIKIDTIAITAFSTIFKVKDPVAPCGACRQVMAEYELKQKTPIRLILAGETDTIYIIESASILLPLLFNEIGLKK